MAKKNKYAPSQECTQAIIFARVSSREQEQGASTDAQLKIMKDECDRKSLKVIKTYNLTESSTRGERKKFWEMIKFVKSQKRKTAIVVHCIDRLQRGYKECVTIEELLTEDKLEIHFLKEGLILHKDSTSSDMTRYDMGVLSAKMYIGSMRDNVKRSLNYNREQGKWQSFAPIGYMNARDLDNRAIIHIDDERAPKVVKLFEEYSTGTHSLQSLHKLAIEMDLCSRQRKGTRIKPITRANIYNMLQNPFYYGIMKTKGELRPHIYPPIIGKYLFDKVQNILNGGEKPEMTRSYKEIPFVFSGLVKCSTCGCTITPETKTKPNGKKYTYLKCSHLRGNCNQGIVNENILFEQLNNEIFNKSIRLSDKMIDLLKKNIRDYLEKESNLSAITKRNVTNSLFKLKDKEARLFDFYLDGNIDKPTYENKKAEIENERKEFEKQSENLVEIDSNIKNTIENIVLIAANASILMKSGTTHQKRELLGLIFKECYLEGKKLVYTLQRPFDKLLKNINSKDFICADSQSISEISNLSNNVNQFKKEIDRQEYSRFA